MAESSNLTRFFEAQFNAVAKLFEEKGPYESPCLRLLEDPQLPLYQRVTCHYMMAFDKENCEFHFKKGLEFLEKIEGMIEDGRVAERFKVWTDRVRGKFEELRAPIESLKAAQQEEDQEEDVDAAKEEGECKVAEEKDKEETADV